MADQKTIAAYNGQVDTYLKMVGELDVDPILLRFIDRLKVSDYVLDLGCGPALASAVMRDKGLCVDPVDAAEAMVKLANDKFNIGARQAQFSDIDATEIYHGVWANFSLLHAQPQDLAAILLALHRALKPQGVLHLGMKLGQGSRRDKYGRYYAYYSQAEFEAHLKGAGFSIEHIELGEALGMAGDMEPWIVLTGVAK
ncbi:class I SAM-dependent methyltransferase [Candidatus Njordibacter sp. Uisw_039]|jgi:predicted TPR repeat methyltransferase|uniref:class I SAM-dependent DNA methyltransferase n=1 Tax=Candidatus Njordibacter sp. Uisw_039 TaxID=3230972 RepID=UPI003D5AB8E6|tara:strand:- start:1156 stop:1749 length:594 start_codon:yes stop_codon:yes gene_type:complete